MRKLLRKIIIWAMGAVPPPETDSAAMDAIARQDMK